VPRATVEQEAANGTLKAVEFKGQPYFRPLGIVYKNGRILSPAMKRFLKTLRESPDGGTVPTANGR
jgi:LysR family transcriptional regulator, transcriptional activator of the cysJI operon